VIPYQARVVGFVDKFANGIAMFAVPLKLTHAIVLAVASLVAVVAFHVTLIPQVPLAPTHVFVGA